MNIIPPIKITIFTIIFSCLSQIAVAETIDLSTMTNDSKNLAQLTSGSDNSKNPCIFQSNPDIDVSKIAIDSLNPDSKNKPVSWTTINFYSPTSPAAKLIGSDPDGKISSISTPNDLSVKLLSGLNADGEFAPGISVEFLPYVLAREKGLTLADYRNSEFQRFLANTKLSIATSKATDNTGTARVGLGVEFVLQNNGDLRTNDQFFKCINNIVTNSLDQNPRYKELLFEDDPKSKSKDELAKIRDELAKIRAEILFQQEPKFLAAKKAAEADGDREAMWILAMGSSWVSPTGKYSDLSGEGMGFWTTYKKGIGTNSQLLFHGSYRSNERISDRKGGFVNADTLLGGVRLLSGDRNFRFSLETAYNRESQGGKQSNDYLSYGIGLEPKVGEDLWISLYFGGTSGRQNGSDFQVMSGFKWNFNTGYQTLADLNK